jgi:hypothetical protein
MPPILLRAYLLPMLLCTALGAAALWLYGPMPVSEPSYAIPHRASFAYMLAAFPFFGVLCGELWLRWRMKSTDAPILLIQMSGLSLLAVARLIGGLPVSGHVLLQVFFVVEAFRFQAQRSLWVLFGALGLLWLLKVKIGDWGDWVTPSGGMFCAAILLIAGALARRSGRWHQ